MQTVDGHADEQVRHCRKTNARSSAGPRGLWVLPLDDERATDPAHAGGKAAALARATTAGLPVLPGFAVTTAATTVARFPTHLPASLETELRAAWSAVTDGGSRSVIVRSSSVIEDGASSSMAGMFESQLDVRGWDSFLDAVAAVLASARSVPGVETAAMAVLVQPMLVPSLGGVLFGADPVTGRDDRFVLAAVEGGPDRLVSGVVDGARYVLSKRGRVVSSERPVAGIGRDQRRALVALAGRVADVFGGPQDVEWAIADDGQLHLLQSRPITATGVTAPARGPVFGPGPVAETFPEALSTLEDDLWVTPLREATVNALRLTRTATRKSITRSPVVTSVGGRVAVDLELFGSAPRRPGSFLRHLDPRPPARRLVAAWQVGRLRAALPGLAADVVAGTDERLLEVPDLNGLDDRQLVSVLRNTQPVLRALHGHEMLAGLLVDSETVGATGASVALWALSNGRASGRSDADIATHDPVVLALASPRVGAEPVLPPVPPVRRPAPTPDPDELATMREALRLRARWAQELGARVAWELGQRLADRGALPDADWVRHLTLTELEQVVAGDDVPQSALTERREAPVAAPLPAAFRLTDAGEAVALPTRRGKTSGAVGAGGGRAVGPVHTGDDPPEAGAVLVVRTLDPNLAPLLPQLGGIVAETGSVLSHLAILARELGVPTVVGVEGATERLPSGTTVVVDGTSGEVSLVIDENEHDDVLSTSAIGGAA
ncbi:MAG: PEP/pyruvate-binding domain-containing protein [Acidimicrobiia bacterium]